MPAPTVVLDLAKDAVSACKQIGAEVSGMTDEQALDLTTTGHVEHTVLPYNIRRRLLHDPVRLNGSEIGGSRAGLLARQVTCERSTKKTGERVQGEFIVPTRHRRPPMPCVEVGQRKEDGTSLPNNPEVMSEASRDLAGSQLRSQFV